MGRGFNLHWIILSKSDAFHYTEAMRENGPVFVDSAGQQSRSRNKGYTFVAVNPFPLSHLDTCLFAAANEKVGISHLVITL